jgi:hypothetical protein
MQSIGVVLKNGGLKAAYATFSHKGRRKRVAAQSPKRQAADRRRRIDARNF